MASERVAKWRPTAFTSFGGRGGWRGGVQTRAFVTRIRGDPPSPLLHCKPPRFIPFPTAERVPRPPTTTTTTRGGCLLSFSSADSPPALFHSASPPPFAASPPEASFAFIEGAMSPFSPFLGEGSLNGREKRTNRAALLFSDSSGTVQSLASRDSMRRARPILTGFNSVFEGEKSLGPEQRQREKEGEGRGIDERAARF